NDAEALQVVTRDSVAPEQVSAYAATLSRLDGVSRVQASTGVYAKGHSVKDPGPAERALGRDDAQRLTVTGDADPSSGAAQDLVHTVRDTSVPGGAETLVGGQAAQLVDSKTAISDRLPAAITMVVVSTFVLLFLFTGSVVQPLRALVLNTISLTAAIGAMVWI